ncbi:MAG TPA: sigma 54-interacting transcriptional regulator [Pedobacter sp.]|nr:sigma 54-interacting transcriptional regulator [Pedobacter sp.]
MELNLERERQILLDLGNDITRVRDKNDLIVLFSKRIKSLFYFTHTIVTLIDQKDDSYVPFLLDHQNSAIRDHIEYDEMVASHFALDEPFIKSVLNADGPVFYEMADVMDKPGSPAFLRVNYEKGIRQILMTTLRAADKPIGFIHIYSDRTDSFSREFQDVIRRIAPQISAAVANILKNEDILKKEREKSFLLDFSSDISAVRSKADLHLAVKKALRKLDPEGGYVIRKLNPDGKSLSAYLHDPGSSLYDPVLLEKVLQTNYPIEDGLQDRVLNSYIPLLFSVDRELQRNSGVHYLELWQNMGFKTMVGAALRNADANIGMLWFSIDEINIPILKGICSQIAVAMANIMANEELLLANETILRYKMQLEGENDYLKEQLHTIYNFSEIIGNGKGMQDVFGLLSKVAETGTTVLILGETGTGKELIARAVHNASPRKNKLMIKLNCAAMPAHLIESELFGHERGAFTGAVDKRIGKFELANHSTIFLDEIGEMPLEAQVKLLRVLQEKEMERVGGTATIKLDVRVIAATNRNLEEEVAAGRFRADLYYRLNVFPIGLPPLRERVEDIEALTGFFLAKYGKNAGKKYVRISPKALEQLQAYLWPGNVRELEHLIERSVLLATNNLIREVYLPKKAGGGHALPDPPADQSLEEMERNYIVRVLQRCNGKISGSGGAADILAIPGNTLHSKMKKLQIIKADYFTK